jgi:CheY-specific phosphatase CheX
LKEQAKIKNIIDTVIKIARGYIKEEMSLQTNSNSNKKFRVVLSENFDRNNDIEIVKMNGAIKGAWGIACNQFLSEYFSEKFIGGILTDEEVQAVLCEIANIVFGNAIQYFPEQIRNKVDIEPPVIIKVKDKIKNGIKVAVCNLKTDYGDFSIYYFTSNKILLKDI